MKSVQSVLKNIKKGKCMTCYAVINFVQMFISHFILSNLPLIL